HYFEKNIDLINSLKILRSYLPIPEVQKGDNKVWWNINGDMWIEKSRNIMIDRRNIGHHWKFTNHQSKLINQYLLANQLLVDCLNGGCYVSRQVREGVATSGYKKLRTAIYDDGYQALFNDLKDIQIDRGTTDQYGIRMLVRVDNVPIKTEIIAEVRFKLDSPRYPQWSPVPCLSINDCFTSKLLANSDAILIIV
ncbi:MAG: hypothetical protein AAGA16_22905, partial [Cyanobacteria bacterium P01_E01_bin.35]